MKLTRKVSGGVPGSKAFLGALQDAITTMWKALSSDEQARYVEMAKKWSKDKPPKDVQAK